MKIYLNQNVFDAALDRIRFIFNEFPQVVVSCSGGKDSTCVLNLALQVAREKGRTPLQVMFLDQEAEWQAVVDYMREIRAMPDVELLWYQIPMRLFNSASLETDWLNCWAEGEQWMRPREPGAITENVYGTDRFVELFKQISRVDFGAQPTAHLTGVRCEESPARSIGLTQQLTYKHVTWGKILNRSLDHYTFHPLYDWSYTDVWAAIHRNGWNYCRIYDEQYRYGVPINKMRVSNLHHETSFASLYYLQEIEGKTWEKLCQRLQGVNTLGHLQGDAYSCPKELPPMFADWRDYRDHLLDNLIADSLKVLYQERFKAMDERLALFPDKERMYRVQIKTLVSNDYHFTQLGNWEVSPQIKDWKNWIRGIPHPNQAKNYLVRMSLEQGVTPAPSIPVAAGGHDKQV